MKGRQDKIHSKGEKEKEKRKTEKLEGKKSKKKQTHLKRNSSDPGAIMHLETHLSGKGK